MRFLLAAAAAFAVFATLPARAETTLCTEIPSAPYTIATGGTWCLKHDLTTNLASGNAITVNASNVVIDLNDYKIANLAAGEATQATGISATNKANISIRNGTIRGFKIGVSLAQSASDSIASHNISNLLFDTNRQYAIVVNKGKNSIIRDNRITNTGRNISQSALGIYVYSTIGTLVEHNAVTGVFSASFASGIYVQDSNATTVKRNTIVDLMAANVPSDPRMIAIDFYNSVQSTAVENLMAKAGTSARPIAGGAGAACYDNASAGFDKPLACQFDSGNNYH